MKVMTYEQKAGIYLRALEQTGSVVEALRAADRAMYSRRVKITDEAKAEMRQRRAAGATLAELAEAYGLVENYVCVLCRGVRKAPVKAAPPSPLGLHIVRIVGEVLFNLEPGWERIHRRGKPGCNTEGRARRVATLAMRAQGLTFQQIGTVLDRDASTVIKNLPFAKEDATAQQLAAVACEILAREAAPIAVPEPAAAQHRAA